MGGRILIFFFIFMKILLINKYITRKTEKKVCPSQNLSSRFPNPVIYYGEGGEG
jgi:hypothetical protein